MTIDQANPAAGHIEDELIAELKSDPEHMRLFEQVMAHPGQYLVPEGDEPRAHMVAVDLWLEKKGFGPTVPRLFTDEDIDRLKDPFDLNDEDHQLLVEWVMKNLDEIRGLFAHDFPLDEMGFPQDEIDQAIWIAHALWLHKGDI